MSVSLPSIPVGSTTWGDTVNGYWQTIQTLLNSLVGQSYLINGGFDFIQRYTPTAVGVSPPSGTFSTVPTDTYGFDRWRMSKGTEASAAIQVARYDTKDLTLDAALSSRYFAAVKPTTANSKFAIYQILEGRDTANLRGRTVTFQVKMKANTTKTIRMALLQNAAAATMDTIASTVLTASNANSTDPTFGTNLNTRIAVTSVYSPTGMISNSSNGGSCTVTTAWQLFSITCAVPVDCENLICVIFPDSTFTVATPDTLYLAEAGLYDGSSARDWLPRPMAAELTLCQRYYEKSYAAETSPGTASAPYYHTLFNTTSPNTAKYGEVCFKVVKRIAGGTPRIWSYAGTLNRAGDNNGTDLAANSCVVFQTGDRSITVYNNSGAAITPPGSCCLFHFDNDCEL